MRDIELPPGWREMKLGELGSLFRGRGGTRADEEPNGLPCIRYGDLYTHHDCIVRSFASSISLASASSYTRLQQGDVVFAGSGETFEEIGKAAAYCNDAPAYAGADTIIFRPGPDLLPRFVGYAVNSESANAHKSRMGQGSSVIHIGSDQLSQMRFKLPPRQQQQRIAEILSTVDEAIEQTEALIAKTQQIKAGLMHDLFTRGVTAAGQLRPPRKDAPQLYKESPLGWIPREWDVVATSEKLAVIDPQPDHRTPPAVLEGYPYVGTGDVTATGEIDFERARKVSAAAFEKQLRSFSIHRGAFIFGKIGTIGQPTRIPHERFFAVSANVVLLTSTNEDDSDYGYWHFKSALTEKQVADATNTTSQPALGIQKVRQFLLAWPSSEVERVAITARLQSIATVLAREALEKEKLCRIKAGLMQDLLTGRVSVAVETAPETTEVTANV